MSGIISVRASCALFACWCVVTHAFRLPRFLPKLSALFSRVNPDLNMRIESGTKALLAGTSRRMNKRRRFHADYFAEHGHVEVVACEHVDDYRAAVEALVQAEDIALEVGCAGGKTTAALGRQARIAFGVDKSVSEGMLSEQRVYAQESKNVHFEQLDANDMGALLLLSARAAHLCDVQPKHLKHESDSCAQAAPLPAGFSVILIDISGNAKLSAVLDLVDRYESCFKGSLRLLIVKSFRLACLLDRARSFEAPS